MLKTCYILLLFLLIPLIAAAQSSWIRINQLGYQPYSIKVAVLGSKGKITVSEFELIDVLTDQVVFRGTTIREYGPYACFEQIYRLDFTNFTQNGTYYIKAGKNRSPQFIISAHVYDGTADFLLQYMRQQRCGYNPFLRDSCHTQDGFIVDHPTREMEHIDVVGGWHDASDYLQYVTTSANATYQMLFAYQQNPGAFGDSFDANGDPGANGIADILDEAKWGLDWLDKMNPSYGVMFNQIADDRDHRKFTLPTLDSIDYGKGRERPVYFVTGQKQGLAKYKNRTTGVSSTAAKFASAFALGARLLSGYYPQFCDNIYAKSADAFRFSLTDLGVCQTASNVSPYFYEEDNYVDDMELAAIQLFDLTGDSTYFRQALYWGDIEKITPWMIADTARHYQWYPFVNLGHFRIAERSAGKIRQRFIRFLREGIDCIYQRARQNGFLFAVPFIWCSNNLVSAMLTQLKLYHSLSADRQYAEMEAALRDWLFGCNPWGTSMIMGLPEKGDTPSDPHAAQTAVFDLKINGGLIDGPVYTSIFNRLIGIRIHNGDEYAEFQSDLCVYHDDYGDYSTNEPTMDGTASLTYYLSSMECSAKAEKEDRYIKRYGAIIRGDTSQKKIYLIFTGGDYQDGGKLIYQVLTDEQVAAHFFFTGDFYRHPQNKSLIMSLKNDGHYLGAHSDRHLLYADWQNRDSTLVTKHEFVTDLKNNYLEMQKFGINKKDALFFLPPYEWYNSTIGKWTKELGLDLVNFSPGTLSNADYTTPSMGNSYVGSAEIYKSILDYEARSKNGLNGFILLMHIGSHPDRTDKFYLRLQDLIIELKSRGYRFVLLSR